MVILDVDGVLTDGRIIYDANGLEYKCFNVHDGYGISRARDLGLKFALLSGRISKVVNHRARRQKITEVYQGAPDKVAVFRKIKREHKLEDKEFCFIGDDEFDLPLLDIVGFSAAPHDAIEHVRQRVDYVTKMDGGRGAVREVLDMILRARKLI